MTLLPSTFVHYNYHQLRTFVVRRPGFFSAADVCYKNVVDNCLSVVLPDGSRNS